MSSITEQIEQLGRALTSRDLERLLSVSKATISREVKAGRLQCFRIGSSVRFDPKAVVKYLEAR